MSKIKNYTKDQMMIEIMNNLTLGQWIKIKYYGIQSKLTGRQLFSSRNLHFLQQNNFIRCANIKGPDNISGEIRGEIKCILEATGSRFPEYILKVREYTSPEMEKKVLIGELLKIIPSDKLTESLKERLDKFSKT